MLSFMLSACPETGQAGSSVAKVIKKQHGEGLYAAFNTNKGAIIVALDFDKVPMTVGNFVALVEGDMSNEAKEAGVPYYDGLLFHRVIKDFMIQGGDPAGNGSGGPGYSFPDEFHDSLRHLGGGILSMANSGPATNGSQFFITHKSTPWLDNKHSVFGHVVGDLKIMNTIEKGDTILDIQIVRVGKAAKKFDALESFNFGKENLVKIQAEKMKTENEAFLTVIKEKYGEITATTKSGLMYQVVQEGTGKQAGKGSIVEVHYQGYLVDGTKFDSSRDRDSPISFPLGQGRVIKGWDEGIALMKVGGKYNLFIPYKMAYGASGRPPIPPKANLIFEVELISVN